MRLVPDREDTTRKAEFTSWRPNGGRCSVWYPSKHPDHRCVQPVCVIRAVGLCEHGCFILVAQNALRCFLRCPVPVTASRSEASRGTTSTHHSRNVTEGPTTSVHWGTSQWYIDALVYTRVSMIRNSGVYLPDLSCGSLCCLFNMSGQVGPQMFLTVLVWSLSIRPVVHLSPKGFSIFCILFASATMLTRS